MAREKQFARQVRRDQQKKRRVGGENKGPAHHHHSHMTAVEDGRPHCCPKIDKRYVQRGTFSRTTLSHTLLSAMDNTTKVHMDLETRVWGGAIHGCGPVAQVVG